MKTTIDILPVLWPKREEKKESKNTLKIYTIYDILVLITLLLMHAYSVL